MFDLVTHLRICSATGLFWNLAGKSRMGFTVKHCTSSCRHIKEIFVHFFGRLGGDQLNG